MTRYARIQDGRVAEIIDLPEGVTVDDAFHPDVAAALQGVSEDVEAGWTFADGEFTAPVPIEPEPADLAAYAAQRRWEVETGGVEVAGNTVATDRESQALINGAFNLVNAMPQPIQFKAAGGFVTLAPEDVVGIAIAVGQHVQACFAKEAEVLAGIDDGSISSVADVDAAFDAI